MYAFAIWDSQEHELYCARDRIGIKPFYYAQRDGYFLFSSEIRGLLAADVPHTVKERVLYDFLARDFYDHNDETFFAGICKLPPGHWMIVQNGQPGLPQRYWNLGPKVERLAGQNSDHHS